MTRPFTTLLIAAAALGAAALAIGPASAMPVAGASALGLASPAATEVEHIRYFRHRGYVHRGFGYHRGFRYHRGYGYRHFGYHRGLPGHPIRRILHAL